MPDTALKNAMARRDVLASEIEKLNQRVHDLRAEVRKIDEWVGMWHDFAKPDADEAPISNATEEHSANPQGADANESVDSERGERTRTTGNPKKEVVAAEARKIIEEAGEPLPRADLFMRLTERGIVIEGKDPEQVLSTMLWRTRDSVPIVRVPGGGYWLAEVPHPQSGYVPQEIDAGKTRQEPQIILEVPEDRTAALARLEGVKSDLEVADRFYKENGTPLIPDNIYEALCQEKDKLEEALGVLA